MQIKIIYDNTTYDEDLKADWGFSCLVEVPDAPKILFDTGASGGILLSNMQRLGIKPETIDEVFISHLHHDHVGGLSDFLEANSEVTIYSPSDIRTVKLEGDKVVIDSSREIHKGIFSTGRLDGIEQSLAIKSEKGLIVVVGCSHPGVGNILKAASQFGDPHALIGGLHGFKDFDLVEDLDLVCPTHCTQFGEEIKSRYPDKVIEGGAGRVIKL